jgi:hypothetical protein
MSRAKADKRNERDKATRADKAAASGGTSKSGKKRKATTDLAEEEMPASSGGSSSPAPSWAETTIKKICFDLLLDRVNNLESKKLRLAEERAEFAERHVKLWERSNAEKAKKIEVLEKKNEVLEKKYQDVLDLNTREYAARSA